MPFNHNLPDLNHPKEEPILVVRVSLRDIWPTLGWRSSGGWSPRTTGPSAAPKPEKNGSLEFARNVHSRRTEFKSHRLRRGRVVVQIEFGREETTSPLHLREALAHGDPLPHPCKETAPLRAGEPPSRRPRACTAANQRRDDQGMGKNACNGRGVFFF